jgi:MFS transporter, PAT family, beta-lactamase induction signal transducer AmpG
VSDARALTAIVLLGFASGLPNTMVGDMLTTWVSKAGWERTDVVLVGWVTLPYLLKVLWAPLVDRLVPPFLGRRRGWLVMAQLAAAIGLAVMAVASPAAPGPLLIAATIVAVAGATFDLAANAYAIEVVPESRLGAVAGLQVWGWRVAALSCATGVPLLAASHGWGAAFWAAAAAQLLVAIAALIGPEPAATHRPASLRAAVVEPLAAIWALPGVVALLAFVLLYRFSDGMASVFTGAFLAERFDLEQLALRGIGGLAGAGIGALLAGLLVARWGVVPCLWIFGVLQAGSNLLYVAIEHGLLHGSGGLLVAVVLDNACGTMAAASFVAFLMARCTRGLAATQYALLTAIGLASPHLARVFASLPSDLGWTTTYLISVAVVVPGLALIPLVSRPPASSLPPSSQP